MESFKENTRSFATRIRADIAQLDYLASLLVVSPKSPSKDIYLSSMEEYMSKIQEHIDSIRGLNET